MQSSYSHNGNSTHIHCTSTAPIAAFCTALHPAAYLYIQAPCHADGRCTQGMLHHLQACGRHNMHTCTANNTLATRKRIASTACAGTLATPEHPLERCAAGQHSMHPLEHITSAGEQRLACCTRTSLSASNNPSHRHPPTHHGSMAAACCRPEPLSKRAPWAHQSALLVITTYGSRLSTILSLAPAGSQRFCHPHSAATVLLPLHSLARSPGPQPRHLAAEMTNFKRPRASFSSSTIHGMLLISIGACTCLLLSDRSSVLLLACLQEISSLAAVRALTHFLVAAVLLAGAALLLLLSFLVCF
jgi:hypothetical protein